MVSKKKVKKSKKTTSKAKKTTSKKKSPEVETNPERTKHLAAWIRSSAGKKAKVEGGHVKTIFEGEVVTRETYRIPRKLLHLNVRNHRFTTEWDNLKVDRQRANKDQEFNLSDPDDVEQIRAVIRGEIPHNKTRGDNFRDLVDGMRIAASEVSTTNGQEQPGIVLEDGRYVNGNRRDTALEFLTNEAVKGKKNKRTGVKTSQFSWIEVGICKKGTTESDVRRMEVREQISKDLRDEYDFMNAAMLVKEEFDSEMLKRANASIKPKERKNLKEIIISDIATDAAKQKPSDIKKYLDFMDFVDQVLESLKREGEYDLVNQSSGTEKPFSYMLKEALPTWIAKPNKVEKLDYAEDMALFVILHQRGGKQFAKGASGYRKNRSALLNKKTKPLINTAKKAIKNFGNPKEKEVEKALQKANEAIRKNEIEKAAKEPTEHLEEILDKIIDAQTSLTKGDTGKKFEILLKKPDLLNEIIIICENIEDLVKKYQKKSKGKKK